MPLLYVRNTTNAKKSCVYLDDFVDVKTRREYASQLYKPLQVFQVRLHAVRHPRVLNLHGHLRPIQQACSMHLTQQYRKHTRYTVATGTDDAHIISQEGVRKL